MLLRCWQSFVSHGTAPDFPRACRQQREAVKAELQKLLKALRKRGRRRGQAHHHRGARAHHQVHPRRVWAPRSPLTSAWALPMG